MFYLPNYRTLVSGLRRDPRGSCLAEGQAGEIFSVPSARAVQRCGICRLCSGGDERTSVPQQAQSPNELLAGMCMAWAAYPDREYCGA